MYRSGLPMLGLAMLIVVAGCSGFFSSPTPIEPTPQSNSSSSNSSLQELENATLWIDGTVERIENHTVYIDDQKYSNVVVPVRVQGSGGFYCHTTNDSDLDCGSVQLNEVQQGEEVCASVLVKNGTLNVIKIFFNATCRGPQAPAQ